MKLLDNTLAKLLLYSGFTLTIWLNSISPATLDQRHLQTAGWSEPLNISKSPTNSGPPALAADPAGTLHMVWVEENLPDQNAMMYSFSVDGIWSTPIDILVNYDLSTYGAPNLGCDSKGNLHLIFSANGIFYSSAYAPLAGSSQNWEAPVLVASPTNYITSPHMTIGIDDSLHVVYAIQIGSQSGIYYLESLNGGADWSKPTPVYLNTTTDTMVDQPRITVDPNGNLHVVWSVANYPENYPPTGIRYASSSDGEYWSEPLVLADGPYKDPVILAKGDNEIHVVWSGTATDRYKFHRYSKDSGQNWLDTWRNEEVGGTTGNPALAFDSSGRIYWLVVGSAFKIDGQAWLYENIFNNGIWMPGAAIYNDSVPEQNMGDVIAQISLGNELHVAAWTPVLESGGGYQGDVFYFQKTIISPALPAKPIAAPTLLPTLKPTSKAPTLTPTRIVLLANSDNRNPDSTNAGIVLGIIPAILLVGVVIFLRVWQPRQSK